MPRVVVRSPLFLLCVLVPFLAPGCGKKASEKAAAPPPARVKVDVAEVKEAPMPTFLTLSGSLAANEDSDVAAGASGKVLATYVERGEQVKKGAILARLDMRLAAAQAREAAAQVKTTKAQRELAAADCERSKQLFAKGAMTKVDYDRAQTSCQTAESNIAVAEARAVAASATLSDAAIRAPFAGLVAERFVSAGEFVRPETKVVTLVQTDPLRLELTIPEAWAARVKPGLAVEFTTAAAGDEKTFEAQVRYVGAAVRRQSRDLVAEAIVKNPDGRLRPGMFVTARLSFGEGPAPVVPKTAVRTDGTLKRVFVAANGRIEDRLVQAGEERGGQVAIVGGLKPGERVVAKATPDLRDGLLIIQ